LESPHFLERFGNRLYQLSANHFNYEHTSPLLSAIKNEIMPEIEWQSRRFGFPQDGDHWNHSIANVDKFLRQRPAIFLKQFEALMQMHDTVNRYLLYPNPAHGEVFVQNGANTGWVQCQVYDLAGREVLSTPLFINAQPAQTHLPLSTLSAGIYMLHFSNSPVTYRLVVY
jgi:hypothetical protein